MIDFGSHSLGIEVADDGNGDLSSSVEIAGGNGLVGIRERVEIYGGDCSAGPDPGGGWVVRVSLPISAADEQHASAQLSFEEGAR